MSTEAKVPVEELAVRFRGEMIPLGNTFSYFSTVPLGEDEVRQYLQDPIAALSPAIVAALGKVGLLLVPYLEKGNGRASDTVHFTAPAETRQGWFSRIEGEGTTVLVFATRDLDIADYHYHFYNAVAGVIADHWGGEVQERYFRLLREELGSEVHGEVDEKSWHLKQALLRRQTNARRETKLFREYARQSFEDTLTLYLHGICCDIDVETGPRQMASRYLRRRLELLEMLYPPPEGYAVFPDELRRR